MTAAQHDNPALLHGEQFARIGNFIADGIERLLAVLVFDDREGPLARTQRGTEQLDVKIDRGNDGCGGLPWDEVKA